MRKIRIREAMVKRTRISSEMQLVLNNHLNVTRSLSSACPYLQSFTKSVISQQYFVTWEVTQ